ncbi:hypothetical protein SAMD00019534_016040, partial [Acytostelium subglobosum LB1]|uniref:hypothetical protein n=1 Tax=Acytostelium subglobosum LB1 TaxID=1410327 RepID=UPI0006449FA2
MAKKLELVLRILVIICCIALVCLTIPYWIYIKYAADNSAWVALALYIVSCVILLILALIGTLGSIKKSRGLLLYFAVVMIIMLLFGIAQIIVTSLDVAGCKEGGNFTFLCSTNTAGYYVPVAIILFINLIGGIIALVLRWKLNNDQPKNFY